MRNDRLLNDHIMNQTHNGLQHDSWYGYVKLGVSLLVTLAVLYTIYLLVTKYLQRNSMDSPIETAKLRFAKGEISKSELDSIKKELE